jgi:hypothetical protein
MSLILRRPPPHLQPELPLGGPPRGPVPPEHTGRSVLVNYGIHRGSFPIAGMRLRDAREVLGRLMNIDPAAVAVVNGTPILDDQTVIGDDVRVLHFVKPSSIKGRGPWQSAS